LYLNENISKLCFFTNCSKGILSQEEINLSEIDKTVVTKTIKNIVKIHQIILKKGKDVIIEEFVKQNNFNLDYDYNTKMKCVFNKYFNFSLQLTNDVRVELIFFNFDDFKNWLNGLAFIIKNKDNLKLIKNSLSK
jgi:hypothetical protein